MCCGDEGDEEGQLVGDGISLHEENWEYSHEGIDDEVHEGFDVQVHEGVDGAHEEVDV